MAKQYDITTKHLIEAHPADWLALAGFPLPPSSADIHIEDSDLSTVSMAADKVIRVDATPPYIAHLEFQAGPDSKLDLRTLWYNAACRNRFELNVRSVVFLLRPAALVSGIVGSVRDEDGPDHRLDFAYRLIRVWELPVQRLLTGGVGTLPLAPISAVEEPQLPAVINQMKQRMDRELPARERAELWTTTRILLGLRYQREFAKQLLKGVLQMEESTTYQEIIEKGERLILLRQGTRKFGPPDATVVAALQAISDPERLAEIGERLLSANNWEELLA